MSAPEGSSSAPAQPPPPADPSSTPSAPGTTSSPPPAPSNAPGPSHTASSPPLSPSFPSTSLHAQPSTSASASVSASASASRSANSPPTTVGASAATTGSQPPAATAAMALNPTLPSRTTQLHIGEARAALVATMSNMLDSELQSRASLLHSNAAALSKQEKDVARGTVALRRETDKLEKLARDTERKIKEIGNVQNWAEVLERDFLVLEETMRLVRRPGGSSGSESCSQCSGSSWSGSYSGEGSRAGSRRGSVTGDGGADADGGAKMNGGEPHANGDVAKDNTTRRGSTTRRERTRVTVTEEVSASISEAMATDLHEPFNSLSLNPEPEPAPSSESHATSASAKGKEPATEDDGVETGDVPESGPCALSHPPDPLGPETGRGS
ncbi:hypothetical protein GGR54DRAFT_634628 [Hypoxylon sp. NC1633]|nr:hypothetical protein GGR54DRAFT_634628 [Hypoxylon sp. NC1633]